MPLKLKSQSCILCIFWYLCLPSDLSEMLIQRREENNPPIHWREITLQTLNPSATPAKPTHFTLEMFVYLWWFMIFTAHFDTKINTQADSRKVYTKAFSFTISLSLSLSLSRLVEWKLKTNIDHLQNMHDLHAGVLYVPKIVKHHWSSHYF